MAGKTEIWFQRDFLLHSTPCHWKGWVSLFLFGTGVMAPCVLGMQWADHHLVPPARGYAILSMFVVMMIAFIWFWWWTEQHTADRPKSTDA